jgi:hypothetical protein
LKIASTVVWSKCRSICGKCGFNEKCGFLLSSWKGNAQN